MAATPSVASIKKHFRRLRDPRVNDRTKHLPLDLLDLDGALVTIDAIGCQKHIAKKILERGGDYVLVAKANQERLLEDIQATVERALDGELPAGRVRQCMTRERGHGRLEERNC